MEVFLLSSRQISSPLRVVGSLTATLSPFSLSDILRWKCLLGALRASCVWWRAFFRVFPELFAPSPAQPVFFREFLGSGTFFWNYGLAQVLCQASRNTLVPCPFWQFFRSKLLYFSLRLESISEGYSLLPGIQARSSEVPFSASTSSVLQDVCWFRLG